MTDAKPRIPTPPGGLGMVLLIGPSLVWCAEYIGSGEVILATRTGAILGHGVLWAVVIGVFLKFWIGFGGARYAVCTGEGMIDLFDRISGRTHWAVWLVLVAQLAAATISIGSIAAAAGAFVHAWTGIPAALGGLLVSAFAVAVAWSGTFDVLKLVMSALVAVTVLGVLYVAGHVLPGAGELFGALLPSTPTVPGWAVAAGASADPWREVLPLLGWGAGGFASQVWYTYWVLGARYGAATLTGPARAADPAVLRSLDRDEVSRLRGWSRLVCVDAIFAMLVGVAVTAAFLIAGAGVLGPRELAPTGTAVATTLSSLFADRWGAVGATLFLIGGTAALVSTLIGQLAGWPRLLVDAFRICVPRQAARWPWLLQFRALLVAFLLTSVGIVFALGGQPVLLVQLSAVLDGLLLTPFQALCVAWGLYVVMPRLFAEDVRDLVRVHWLPGVGLLAAAVFFGYFCVVQLPAALGLA